MKYTFNPRFLYVTGILLIAAFPSLAQNYTHQVEAGISAIRVSDKKHGGFMYHNRYTAFVHPKVGVAGTFGFLTSSYFPARGEFATKLSDQFQKNYLMGDVSAVFLPLKIQKHSLRVTGGVSWRQRSESEPFNVYQESSPYTPNRWVVESQYVKTQDIGLHASIGYEHAFTDRFATGVELTAYNYDRGAAILALGIQGRYKFDITKESLGFTNGKVQMTGWGVKGGINVSDLIEFNDYLLSRKSFHAGFFADFAMRKRFSFRSELLYSGKGARTPSFELPLIGLNFPTRMVFQLHYLDVPLLINYNVYKNFRLYTGVQPGFLLAQRAKVKGGSGKAEGGNQIELSLAAGAMYELSRFHVDVRYTHGVISIVDRSNPNNQVLQASLGYRLSKK
jgi:hypothetical protein